MSTTQAELRLQSLLDEREQNTKLHETVLAAVEASDSKLPSESQAEQIQMYREKAISLDTEIEQLAEDVERNRRAVESSKAIRRALAGNVDGIDVHDDGIVYRNFYTYARDFVLTRSDTLAKKWVGDESERMAMRERQQLLKRTPANTLSTDVGGLQPDQHIAQIFQVINAARPLVDTARRTTLDRGSITYPSITQRPVVAVQASEKTEAGNQKMTIDMETATASTYLGGGDISWQAINWSTPDALAMWFDLAAEDYAIKTEADAGQVLTDDAFTNAIGSPLGATPTFAQFMTAVGAGGSEVYTNSRRMANTVYLAVDRWWYLFGTTSDAQAMFTNVDVEGVGPLRFVATAGLDDGAIVVGDRNGLLVAETAGAPVELRVVEPAIGGVEVGIIGAFEAVVVDPGAFALITTAS